MLSGLFYPVDNSLLCAAGESFAGRAGLCADVTKITSHGLPTRTQKISYLQGNVTRYQNGLAFGSYVFETVQM